MNKKSKIVALLTVVMLLGVMMLGLTASAAAATSSTVNTTTMTLDWQWLDLETGTVVNGAEANIPSDNTSDFCIEYPTMGAFNPPAILMQNQMQGVKVAYVDKPFDDVTFGDVAGLAMTTNQISAAFNKVAVLETAEGNYYKVGYLSESVSNVTYSVTFQWAQLVPPTLESLHEEHTRILQQLSDLSAGQVNIAQQVAALDTGQPDVEQQISDLNQKVDDLSAKLDTVISLIQDLPISQGSGKSAAH